jgi:Fe-S-cluster-containing dehydrogenase component
MTQSDAVKTPAMIKVTINNREIEVEESVTIFDAADRLGIKIPALCHRPDLGMNAVGICRACVVDTGEKTFAAACVRPCGTLKNDKGKIASVVTNSSQVESVRKTLLELLLAEHPRPCKRHQETHDCELELLGEQYGLLERPAGKNVAGGSFPGKKASEKAIDAYPPLATLFHPAAERPKDTSNVTIAVDHSSCILCDRCVRACNDIAGNDILGRFVKGKETTIGFDNAKAMGASNCVNCGWCMVACPTGALVYSGPGREYAFDDRPDIKPLTVDQMKDLDFVRDAKVSTAFLARFEGGIRLRHFKKGELIVEQGDHGHTAFYIDSGKVNIYLSKAVVVEEPAGVLPRLLSLFSPKKSAAAGPAPARRMISVDANVDLDSEKLMAQLPEADSMASRLFGEASCRNGQERSATVRAAEDNTLVLEMHRDMLDLLLRSPKFREDFNRVNRRRLIDNYLRASPLFAGIKEVDLKWLEDRTQIVNFTPGQTIFQMGNDPDFFYMVRLGHVKVEKNGDVLNYLTRGQFFGEMSLLVDGLLRGMDCVALDNVELLAICKTDFDELLKRVPSINAELLRVKAGREDSNRARFAAKDPTRSAALQEYLHQELFEGQSLLLIDLDKCTRCDECVRACAQSHHGVARMVRDGQRFGKYLVPTACRSCHDPKCLGGCPVDAIHRTKDGGLAIVIEDHCIGCGYCFGQDLDGNDTGTGCPYGNIFPQPAIVEDPFTHKKKEGRKATVCDLDHCTAEEQDPSCVYACPHDAALRVNGHEFFGKELLRIGAVKTSALESGDIKQSE